MTTDGADELTARPRLTRADEDVAEARVALHPEDHLAAGKADAIDHGTSGGEAEAAALRSEEERARRRRS